MSEEDLNSINKDPYYPKTELSERSSQKR